LRSNTQQKQGFWERRRIYFAAAREEIRPDGEFLDKNEDPGQGCPGRTAFLRSSLRKNAQQKERAWERRRIYFAVAWEEIRLDGEFLDKN
jgi:hypothetical protein